MNLFEDFSEELVIPVVIGEELEADVFTVPSRVKAYSSLFCHIVQLTDLLIKHSEPHYYERFDNFVLWETNIIA